MNTNTRILNDYTFLWGGKKKSVIQMSIFNQTFIRVHLISPMAKIVIFYVKIKVFRTSGFDSYIDFCFFRNQRNFDFSNISLSSLDDGSINDALVSVW